MNIYRKIQSKCKEKLGSLSNVAFVLALIVILLCVVYYWDSRKFFANIESEFVIQELIFPYYLKPGDETSSTLIIGDLNGLNSAGYNKTEEIVKRKDINNKEPLIAIPSLLPQKSENMPRILDAESLLNQAVNTNNVVVVDNFCTKNWSDLRGKEIYKSSFVSPGSFCGSEPEIRDMESIIQKYHVKKVVLLFNTESYKQFVSNFTEYLTEKNINYSFVASDEFNDIF